MKNFIMGFDSPNFFRFRQLQPPEKYGVPTELGEPESGILEIFKQSKTNG